VQVDVAPVAVPRARPDREPLGRQSPLGEIKTEGEAVAALAAPKAVLKGETGGELLGLGAVGAGWMPAPPLPTADRIKPLVDHRVLPVALARHIPLHPNLPPGAGRTPTR